MDYEKLKLKNQICFPIYALSRLITREYQPHLDNLGITYPQYLTLMILWEEDGLTVNHIAKKLVLKTNTVTPLLKRLEQQGLVIRQRSNKDERKVIVRLTEQGLEMQKPASLIPEQLAKSFDHGGFDLEDLIQIKDRMEEIIQTLSKK